MKKTFVLIALISTILTARGYSFNIFKYYSARSYSRGGALYLQNGYIRKSTGKYVAPHLKTRSDNYKWNNLAF